MIRIARVRYKVPGDFGVLQYHLANENGYWHWAYWRLDHDGSWVRIG